MLRYADERRYKERPGVEAKGSEASGSAPARRSVPMSIRIYLRVPAYGYLRHLRIKSRCDQASMQRFRKAALRGSASAAGPVRPHSKAM